MKVIYSNLVPSMQLRSAATHEVRCAHIVHTDYGGVQQSAQVLRILNNALIVARMQYRVAKSTSVLVGYYSHTDNQMIAEFMQKCGYQIASFI
jgi:hypothetical protein